MVLWFCLASFAFAQEPGSPEKSGDGHDVHKHAKTQPKAPEKKPSGKLTIPDIEVLDQDGKPVKFYTDLVKGKKVMISFVFTSCRLACPMVGRNFQKLQEQIGSGLGKDVFLISVTTDPLIDTPKLFKKWGEKFGRREGWTLVTGDEANINNLLLPLTGSTRQREGEHISLVILFDGVSGASENNSSLMTPIILLDALSKLGKDQ
jgi:protein SCO1/2